MSVSCVLLLHLQSSFQLFLSLSFLPLLLLFLFPLFQKQLLHLTSFFSFNTHLRLHSPAQTIPILKLWKRSHKMLIKVLNTFEMLIIKLILALKRLERSIVRDERLVYLVVVFYGRFVVFGTGLIFI